MTVNNFITTNKDKVTIGTTAIRTYIKENKSELEKEGIVKFTKKPNSLCIDIIKEDELISKINK